MTWLLISSNEDGDLPDALCCGCFFFLEGVCSYYVLDPRNSCCVSTIVMSRSTQGRIHRIYTEKVDFCLKSSRHAHRTTKADYEIAGISQSKSYQISGTGILDSMY
jgi:hypothetical protein